MKTREELTRAIEDIEDALDDLQLEVRAHQRALESLLAKLNYLDQLDEAKERHEDSGV